MKTQKLNSFDEVKRNFEVAHANGNDYTEQLTNLATAIVYSVLKKVIDPQRKTAGQRQQVSNSGINPQLVKLRAGIAADLANLNNVRQQANAAYRNTLDDDGDPVTLVNDEAEKALNALIGQTLSDGVDLVNEAIVAILEQAREHANGEKWLDTPYEVRRLSKRVLIKESDSAAYRDIDTTPIQEVYRAVRTAIADSRAVQSNSKYIYIEEHTEEELEHIYRRLPKYIDLGSYASDIDGHTDFDNYTADSESVKRFYKMLADLNLTDRQAEIIRLRMQGKGIEAISTYLGISKGNVCTILTRLRKRANEKGYTVR